jgi:hypothetical protein
MKIPFETFSSPFSPFSVSKTGVYQTPGAGIEVAYRRQACLRQAGPHGRIGQNEFTTNSLKRISLYLI